MNAPLVWLLLSDKPGDNEQVLALAELLGVPAVTKRVLPLARYVKGKPFFRASIAHLDTATSDPLVAPWPDLVVTIGRRPTMAALWIRRQSGNRTRIVMLGRQPRFLQRFALVISSSQYITANDPRILRIALPLDRAQAAAPGAATIIDATAVLIGGPGRTYRLTPADAGRLLALARQETGGQPLLVLTSRRTPADVVDWLDANMPAGSRLLRWRAGQPSSPSYREVIEGCPRFIVTGDSISMLCDVVRATKPLAIFRLAPRNAFVAWWHARVLALAPLDDGRRRDGVFARLVRALVDGRWMRLPRSFDAFHAFLRQHRAAAYLEDGFLDTYAAMPDVDRQRVAARLAAVLDNWRSAADVSSTRSGPAHAPHDP